MAIHTKTTMYSQVGSGPFGSRGHVPGTWLGSAHESQVKVMGPAWVLGPHLECGSLRSGMAGWRGSAPAPQPHLFRVPHLFGLRLLGRCGMLPVQAFPRFGADVKQCRPTRAGAPGLNAAALVRYGPGCKTQDLGSGYLGPASC